MSPASGTPISNPGASTCGLIIAAAASGSGKTTLTLGLLRLLARQGVAVRGCKIGPDYIDPAFHAAASGAACFNLDAWAMREQSLATVIAATEPHDLLIVEGVMGLFDGAAMATDASSDLPAGSTAQLAAETGWPVVLVLNVKGQGATAAAIAQGLRDFHAGVHVAGVICNNVGSPRHAEILRQAFGQAGITLLGLVPRDARLQLPDRHLGLIQASGNLWQWGHDGDPDEPRASLVGGSWWFDGDAGSRQALLGCAWPGNSSGSIGARGRCDHLQPV